MTKHNKRLLIIRLLIIISLSLIWGADNYEFIIYHFFTQQVLPLAKTCGDQPGFSFLLPEFFRPFHPVAACLWSGCICTRTTWLGLDADIPRMLDQLWCPSGSLMVPPMWPVGNPSLPFGKYMIGECLQGRGREGKCKSNFKQRRGWYVMWAW